MRVTEQAHEAVRAVVEPGETVVDATAGNGHDTLFLARLVGSEGCVLAFDVQEEALAATRVRLTGHKIGGDTVVLLQESHVELDKHVTAPVAAVMFNLGYLPGSDRQCRTTPGETLRALALAWDVLREGGILSVVCYRGHAGGAEEAGEVVRFAEACSSGGASLTILGRGESETGPFLVALRKRPPL